jgi:excisionase family DNA binding protein
MEDRHLSLSEVAGAMGVSERTVRRWIKSGKLRAYKPGRDYRIPESAIRTFMEESEIAPKEQRRSSLEPSLLNGLEEKRRPPLSPWAEHARRMAGRVRHHTDDPNSPAFRDAWAALFFVEEKNREVAELWELLFEEELGWEAYGDEPLTALDAVLAAFEELAESLAEAQRRADQMAAGFAESEIGQARRRTAEAAAQREQAVASISPRLERRRA